jgi:hypothetical protein
MFLVSDKEAIKLADELDESLQEPTHTDEFDETPREHPH